MICTPPHAWPLYTLAVGVTFNGTKRTPWSFSADSAAARIWPIQHHDLDFVLGRRLHHQPQRADIRVKTTSRILNIKDQRVNALETFPRRFAPLAVQAENRQAGLVVLAVRYFLVDGP